MSPRPTRWRASGRPLEAYHFRRVTTAGERRIARLRSALARAEALIAQGVR